MDDKTLIALILGKVVRLPLVANGLMARIEYVNMPNVKLRVCEYGEYNGEPVIEMTMSELNDNVWS